MNDKPATIDCPMCGKPSGERWQPFCSERCKLADLGQWFAGRYAIPDDSAAEPPDNPPRDAN